MEAQSELDLPNTLAAVPRTDTLSDLSVPLCFFLTDLNRSICSVRRCQQDTAHKHEANQQQQMASFYLDVDKKAYIVYKAKFNF